MRKQHILSTYKMWARWQSEGCCAYCREKLRGLCHPTDHVAPESKGGPTDRSNLAAICDDCNRRKFNFESWVDPYDGMRHPLFNPLKDSWHEHFRKEGSQIVGITPIGRATAHLLFRKISDSFNPPDLHWPLIAPLEGCPVYQQLNDLRYYRLRHDFKGLADGLTLELQQFDQLQPYEKHLAEYAHRILFLESCLYRGKKSDFIKGIHQAEALLDERRGVEPERTSLIKYYLGFLLVQQAALQFLEGDGAKAIRTQRRAYEFLESSNLEPVQVDIQQPDRAFRQVSRTLLRKAVRGKYTRREDPVDLQEVVQVLNGSPPQFAAAVTRFVASAFLAESKPRANASERVLCLCDARLRESGYGYGSTIPWSVTLRRRWWSLRLLLSDGFDFSLLDADVALWNDLQMFSELRELRCCVEMFAPHIKREALLDLRHILTPERLRSRVAKGQGGRSVPAIG